LTAIKMASMAVVNLSVARPWPSPTYYSRPSSCAMGTSPIHGQSILAEACPDDLLKTQSSDGRPAGAAAEVFAAIEGNSGVREPLGKRLRRRRQGCGRYVRSLRDGRAPLLAIAKDGEGGQWPQPRRHLLYEGSGWATASQCWMSPVPVG
jgi:hypothetical protein